MSKTETAPIRISEEEQDKDNPLRGLLKVTKTKEIEFEWDKFDVVESKDPNEDGDYRQQSWSIRNHQEAELGTIYFCTELFRFYHLGLKSPGLDGKDKADRMGLSKDMPACIKKMVKNLWREQYNKVTKLA